MAYEHLSEAGAIWDGRSDLLEDGLNNFFQPTGCPAGSAGVGACNRAARWIAQIDILKFECRKAEQDAAHENHRRSERHDFRFRTHVCSRGLGSR